jgi:hypothetical protein
VERAAPRRTCLPPAAVYASVEESRACGANAEGTGSCRGRRSGGGGAWCTGSTRFGGQGRGRLATEDSPFALGSTGDLYSRSKNEAHWVALDAARAGQDVVIVAPCGPIGPGDVGPTPTGRLLCACLSMPVLVVVPTAASPHRRQRARARAAAGRGAAGRATRRGTSPQARAPALGASERSGP